MSELLIKETVSVHKPKVADFFSATNLIFSCGIVLWNLTPFLFRNIPPAVLVLLFAGWFLSFFPLLSRIKTHSFNPTLILPILWFVYLLFYKIIGYSTSTWGNYFVQFFFWLTIYMGFITLNVYTKKEKKLLLAFIWIVSIINLVDNIRLNIIFPSASADIYTSWNTHYLSMNIGDTGYTYLTFLFFCFNVWILLFTKKRKIFAIIGILLSLTYLYLSARAITTLLAVFTIFGWLISIAVGKKKSGRAIKYIITISVALLFVILAFPLFTEFLSNYLPDNKVTWRMQEICNLFYGSSYSTVNSGELRLADSLISIKTWFSSPISFLFGVGFHGTDATSSTIETYGIGQHSGIIDNLARYGLIGEILFLSALIIPIVGILKKINFKGFFAWIYLSFILFALMNSFNGCSYLGIFLFVLYPACEDLVRKA